nr:reverse transcriptase domain-containing protein [Tanacetum cinerariifolium]
MLPITQINTFYNGLTLRHRDTINAAAGGTFMKRCPEECYDLIENMTAHHNDWDTSTQRITPNYETYGGLDSYNDCATTVDQTQNVYIAGAYQGGNSYQPQGNHNLLSYRLDNYLGPPGFNQNQNRNNQNQNFQNQNRNQGIPQVNNQGRNQFFQGASHGQNPPPAYQALAYQALCYQAPVHQPPIPQPQMDTTLSSGSGTLLSNTITNPNEDLKGITTRSGTAYQGPTIPTTSSSLPKVVKREAEVTKDTMPPTNNGSTKYVQPLVVQIETLIPNSEPVVAPVAESVGAPVSALKPNQKLSIPYSLRLHDQKLHDKANDQKDKFFQIFQDLNFNISFADALVLMPKFSPTIKTLLTNKEKLYELARTPRNEHCSAVLLKKLPEKLGDPGKFLIPCDFSGMGECLALADLGASINPMPLSVWNKLSLLELTPTLMTLELADRSISRPIGVAEDVFVKVGKFNFPADFIVVDFEADPRVPLILGRSFLKTRKALIDVYEGELTLRVGKEAITFNLDQTSRYSANYNDMMANRIDVIDMASKNNKSSIDEPPEVELKDLPPNLEYVFLEGDDKLPVIIAKDLSVKEKVTLVKVLKSHKQAIAWKLSDIKGIDPKFYTRKILMEDDFKPAVQHQRRVNPKIHYVIKKDVLKLLDAGLIYPISDSPWVSPVHCVPKKGGFTVVKNEENELIPTRLVTGWCVCIDYRKLNEATRKDHFPLPFMDQMLERLAGNEYYCFLNGFSGYFQIPIDPKDQENTTFTCPYRTFA